MLMLKVVLNDIFINFRKSWLQILLNLTVFAYVGSYIFVFTTSFHSTTPITLENFSSLAGSKAIVTQSLPFISALSLILLFGLAEKMPLRLSKAIFVCAAGEKEKMQYISLQLIVKIIFSFVFIFIVTYAGVCRFLSTQSAGLNIIQLSLWFFIILNINLKVGIGEKGLKKKDIHDYIIYSKEEEIVNYYWVCLLFLEAIVFYTLSFLNVPLTLPLIIGWTLVFISNVYISHKCVSPILKKSLSYEDVYRQIPATKEGY